MEWYDKLAGGYDELYSDEQSLKYEVALNATSSNQLGVVVDVACGTGLFLERLRRLSDLVVGVDLSRPMLERARRRGRFGNVGLVRADCSSLPFKNDVTDSVFVMSLLKHGRPMIRQLSEMARISRRDGIIVGSVFRDGGEKRLPDGAGLARDPVFWDLSDREFLFRVRRAML